MLLLSGQQILVQFPEIPFLYHTKHPAKCLQNANMNAIGNEYFGAQENNRLKTIVFILKITISDSVNEQYPLFFARIFSFIRYKTPK
jgi:hypothetical protein